MTDIHCHILYGVDDGAKDYEEALAMLEDAADQGITNIIATPHYRQGMFPYIIDDIKESYELISARAAGLGLGFRLGCEYHADSEMIDNIRNRRIATMAGSDYVLTEFSSEDPYIRIRNKLDELAANGFIPIIAHAERIRAFREDTLLLEEVRKLGAKVQLNADSILGADGNTIRKACKKILKSDLADIVASDSHDLGGRRCRMSECMKHVASKYGEDRARKLFDTNPGEILNNRG